MNEHPEEFGSDSSLTEAPSQFSDSLTNEFVRPSYKFKELELWPFTEGSDILYRQISHQSDTGLTRALKFIFVHQKRGGSRAAEDMRQHIVPLAWAASDAIHQALFEWVEKNIRGDADKVAACELVEKIVAAAKRASADIATTRGKKKEAASRRRKSLS